MITSNRANHNSFLDILAIGKLHPKIIFLVNDWVYNSPVFGKAVQLAGFYPVSNGLENGLDHLKEKVAQGYSLMAFPEGTRSKTHKINRFHKGAFYLAEYFNLDPYLKIKDQDISWDKSKSYATRVCFGQLLDSWSEILPTLIGGSADLDPSNMTAAFAKKVGDFLLVSLTSDEFVNKGPGRPIFTTEVRAKMVEALTIVDGVIISKSKSAEEMINLVKPDIYFKGPDYKDNTRDHTKKIYKEIKALKKIMVKFFIQMMKLIVQVI